MPAAWITAVFIPGGASMAFPVTAGEQPAIMLAPAPISARQVLRVIRMGELLFLIITRRSEESITH
jgi:hypothetical protein